MAPEFEKLIDENDFGIEPAALRAIISVESAGDAFWNIGPVIRFEGHIFYRLLDGNKRIAAVEQGLASPTVGGVKNPSTAQGRYDLLSRARKIDSNAAIQATSWGLGQILGTNYKALGYSTPALFEADTHTYSGQLHQLMMFIKVNDLIKYLDKKDWASFAKAYNGPAYKKNAYDKKLATAYKKFSLQGPVLAESNDTIEFQKKLSTLLKIQLDFDGVIGAQTVNAVKQFQAAHGLTVDGALGPLTKQAINEAYAQRTTQADQKTTSLSASGAVIAGTLSQAADKIEPLKDFSPILMYLFVGLVIAGVFFAVRPMIWKQ